MKYTMVECGWMVLFGWGCYEHSYNSVQWTFTIRIVKGWL